MHTFDMPPQNGRILPGGLPQRFERAALPDTPAAGASASDFLNLTLEQGEFGNPRLHVANMVFKERIYLVTRAAGVILQIQQDSDLRMRHIERAAPQNKAQPLFVSLVVGSIVVCASLRRLHQAFALVITNGLHLAACARGQLSNLHAISFCLTLYLL